MGRLEKQGTTEALFQEEQRFTQWFIWILLLGLLCIPVYGILKQIGYGEPFGNKPMSNLGLVLLLIFMLCFCYFFWWIRLKTTVTRNHIQINYIPLARKTILWREVKKAEIVKYSPWIGYGLRIWTPYGTVYNVKGRKGLALTLKNGKKLMIGTQRDKELEEVARSILKSL